MQTQRQWVEKPGLALILDDDEFQQLRERWRSSTENTVRLQELKLMTEAPYLHLECMSSKHQLSQKHKHFLESQTKCKFDDFERKKMGNCAHRLLLI